MGVTIGESLPSAPPPREPEGSGTFRRTLHVTDRDGVEHEIVVPEDLQRILAQMTPQELEDWKTRYRFAPVENLTGNKNYTGTIYDLM
jgi:hypothetical protein